MEKPSTMAAIMGGNRQRRVPTRASMVLQLASSVVRRTPSLSYSQPRVILPTAKPPSIMAEMLAAVVSAYPSSLKWGVTFWFSAHRLTLPTAVTRHRAQKRPVCMASFNVMPRLSYCSVLS